MYLSLITVNQNRVVRLVQQHSEGERDAAMTDCHKGILVGLDGYLEVLDAVLLYESCMALRVWSSDKSTSAASQYSTCE